MDIHMNFTLFNMHRISLSKSHEISTMSMKFRVRGQSFLSPDTRLECFLRGAIFLAKNLRGLNITRKILRALKITRTILRGAKFPVPEGIRGMTFSSARENKV